MSASSSGAALKELLTELPAPYLEWLLADWTFWARDDQLPPELDSGGEPWRVWLILGGRGAGKTRAGAEWVRAKALGVAPLGGTPAKRIALVGETMAEVRRVMIEGVSGILSVHGGRQRPRFEPSSRDACATWSRKRSASAPIPTAAISSPTRPRRPSSAP